MSRTRVHRLIMPCERGVQVLVMMLLCSHCSHGSSWLSRFPSSLGSGVRWTRDSFGLEACGVGVLHWSIMGQYAVDLVRR